MRKVVRVKEKEATHGLHREAGARPLAAGADHLHLLVDAVALLAFPLPDLLEELLAAELVARLVLLAKHLLLHHHLRTCKVHVRVQYGTE